MNEIHSVTLDKILSAALHEFLEKGYRRAGLREIAKAAGVTTGALYGYFKNKEELFEALVKEPYSHIIEMYRTILTDFSALPASDQCGSMREYTDRGVSAMTDYIYSHLDAFRLIISCSDGTEYSSLIHKLARLDTDATHDFTKASDEIGIHFNKVNPLLEHMLTTGMFSTYFELISHNVPREEADEYICQMLDFYSAGWAKIMGF